MKDVYITAAGTFLPGPPIGNAEMEDYLGRIHEKESRKGPFVLRQNRIKTRHYALNISGIAQYSSAQMAAAAITQAVNASEVSLQDIDFLASSATLGDVLVPGLASHIHGALGIKPIELANYQSVCASSMMALKGAFLQIRADGKTCAAVSGVEFASRYFRPGFYEGSPALDAKGELCMEAEFLRWTLSDGAGALLIEPRANRHRPSLKIEWIDLCSYADRFDTCMVAGVALGDHHDLTHPWASDGNPAHSAQRGAVMLLQDFDRLKKMFPVWVAHYVSLVEAGKIRVDDIDWVLCHYSAHSLREEMIALLERTGCMIPEEKWFTNLYEKGNTGSASLFIMIEELLNSGRLRPGETLLCVVPESGRSIISHMLLSVV